jgi:serine/threonine-protein kinase
MASSTADAELERWLGQRLEDRFEVLRLLARGGMGAVFVGWDERFELEVAIKVLPRCGAAIEAELEPRFLDEARMLAQIRDPRVVRPLSWGRVDDGLYIVSELLEGQPLDALIGREGPLASERVARFLIDITAALAEAHARGIVHRDIKPGNVFIQSSPSGGETARLLDFGVARPRPDARQAPDTSAGVVMGTPQFMAPEQACGQAVDGRADLYALGVLAFTCLAGERPFPGEGVAVMMAHASEPPPPFAAVAPGVTVDAELAELVFRLLEKDPDARPASATVVRAALEDWLARARSTSPPATARDEDAGPVEPVSPAPSRPLGIAPPDRSPSSRRSGSADAARPDEAGRDRSPSARSRGPFTAPSGRDRSPSARSRGPFTAPSGSSHRPVRPPSLSVGFATLGALAALAGAAALRGRVPPPAEETTPPVAAIAAEAPPSASPWAPARLETSSTSRSEAAPRLRPHREARETPHEASSRAAPRRATKGRAAARGGDAGRASTGGGDPPTAAPRATEGRAAARGGDAGRASRGRGDPPALARIIGQPTLGPEEAVRRLRRDFAACARRTGAPASLTLTILPPRASSRVAAPDRAALERCLDARSALAGLTPTGALGALKLEYP